MKISKCQNGRVAPFRFFLAFLMVFLLSGCASVGKFSSLQTAEITAEPTGAVGLNSIKIKRTALARSAGVDTYPEYGHGDEDNIKGPEMVLQSRMPVSDNMDVGLGVLDTSGGFFVDTKLGVLSGSEAFDVAFCLGFAKSGTIFGDGIPVDQQYLSFLFTLWPSENLGLTFAPKQIRQDVHYLDGSTDSLGETLTGGTISLHLINEKGGLVLEAGIFDGKYYEYESSGFAIFWNN